MKLLRYAAMAVALIALPLGGCTTIQGLFGNSTATQDVEKSLTVAHLAHKGLADELKYAADAGLITGTNAGTARQYLDQSEGYLVQADSAWKAGQSITSQLNAATSLMAQASPLIPAQAKQ